MATMLQLPQSQKPSEPTPQQSAASHVAQAWADLGAVEGREAREICSILRALISRIENIQRGMM